MRKSVFNFRWLFFQSLYILLILLGVFTWDAEDTWYSIAVIVLGALLIIGYFVFFPHLYRFDDTGITFCYFPGFSARIRWSEIRSIDKTHDRSMPWLSEYIVSGLFDTKLPIGKQAVIIKTRKTAEIISAHWHKKI